MDMLQQKINKRKKKNYFIHSCKKITDKTPRNDLLVILGDFNTRIGKEKAYNKVAGEHTLHDNTNNNGEFLCNFAIQNNLIVASTQFSHKRIYTGMWLTPDNITLNQVDHVVSVRSKRRMIIDVKTCRGYKCDSDHFLVQVLVKQKLVISKVNGSDKKKWDEKELHKKEKMS
jgi:endonuclease/exonuclease/phosphatase family metal-dependent hydrolase